MSGNFSYTVYYVICEGKSEENYIQKELNRYLRDKDFNFSFKPVRFNGGGFPEMKRSWKRLHHEKKNEVCDWKKRGHVFFWADWDVFQRNEGNCRILYDAECSGLPPFLFSYHNFEDFLSLHFKREAASSWRAVCSSLEHKEKPMEGNDHLSRFKKLLLDHGLGEYEKADLPKEFDISEGLEYLKQNCCDSRLHWRKEKSFASFLLDRLKKDDE